MSTFDSAALLARRFEPVVFPYSRNDSILYALSVGFGEDPQDGFDLAYVYEEAQRVAPSMAVVLGYPGMWMKDPAIGVVWQQALHAGQVVEVHDELPVEGTVVGHTRVKSIEDKGSRVGALITVERQVRNAADDRLLATVEQIVLARGNGGFSTHGSGATPRTTAQVTHLRRPATPDAELTYTVPKTAALLYRLTGDTNPLHADPQVAREAGFDAPILHGLCTFGVAGRALLRHLGPDRDLAYLSCRFTSPVYPGDRLVTRLWQGADGSVAFDVTVPERKAVAIKDGRALARKRKAAP